ncbi:glycosyl hydrolase family 81 protein [Nitzschia inconspicua]|uniref:glucan endo-1,3-beta-D-glucosidase n=1 Tax=Nitzschia inconspicua TaxID=303405 RepID=A0A9K3LYE2_9STRA|nr:glycosyl hydrolase family 81 protein [Nitzschia inconspicua]
MTSNKLRRGSSEIKDFLGDDSSLSFPRQQSFFQDERSSGDLESPTGAEPMSLNYSIENGLQSFEISDDGRHQGHLGCLGPGTRRRKRVYMLIITAVLFVIMLSLAIALGTGSRKETSSAASISGPGAAAGQQQNGSSSNKQDDTDVYPPAPSSQNEARYYASSLPPLSTLDPVEDLNLYAYERPQESSPSTRLNGLNRRAIPTNAWYQNILRLNAGEEPTSDNKAYLMPYVVDMAGDVPGVRTHVTRILAEPSQVTLTIDEPYALTLGVMAKGATQGGSGLGKGYTVREATELGITLEWDAYDMKSSLVRGSPFITMVYNNAVNNAKETASATTKQVSTTVVPTIYSEVGVSNVRVDGSSVDLDQYCGSSDSNTTVNVQSELDLSFFTGQRWLVYFSRQVAMQCRTSQGGNTIIQLVGSEEERKHLIVRAAQVLTSALPSDDVVTFENNYIALLRANRDLFPGERTSVHHSFDVESGPATYTKISFNWDPQSMSGASSNGDMVMFALPHHQDLLKSSYMRDACVPSILGPICLIQGTSWELIEPLPTVDFRAPRHPSPDHIGVIAEALVRDIKYQIPANFQIGAADTYFSGKTMAKLARILLITEELKEICNPTATDPAYAEACNGITLPSDEDFDAALDQLRRVVTVWIKDNDQAPFVFDTAWGGVVSCGCLYQDGQCSNRFPSCPAFTDQGLNFGGGFYNDHHFHYGYHVYAAAVVAHYDEDWARENYENVLLLVRDYANPSTQDTAFPVFRNKDFFNGHSWANGITNPIFNNIMNQESTSEAIASYEAVALFGKAMASVFRKNGDVENASKAEMMQNIGMSLTATEIRSTQKYWHVLQDVDDSDRIYPREYEANVIGILWSTFVQFGTWFGNSPYLIYGIQLLPLTPISEARDNVQWAKEIYGPLAASCNDLCVSSGWSVQLFAILATIGHPQEAVEQTLRLSPSVYEGPGGNGHSRSNTLWYIATRPSIEEPYPLEDLDLIEITEVTCSQPDTCTSEYLNSMAGEYSCRARIEWLMNVQDLSEMAACAQVARDEFPEECGLCFPEGYSDEIVGAEALSQLAEETLTCFQPDFCTHVVLDRMAGSFTCRDRIEYLIARGVSEEQACLQIAGIEYPAVCGECIPNR